MHHIVTLLVISIDCIYLGTCISYLNIKLKNTIKWWTGPQPIKQALTVTWPTATDIPDAYGLDLSQDWSTKLEGYFASDWSHMWFPYKGCQNQIKC